MHVRHRPVRRAGLMSALLTAGSVAASVLGCGSNDATVAEADSSPAEVAASDVGVFDADSPDTSPPDAQTSDDADAATDAGSDVAVTPSDPTLLAGNTSLVLTGGALELRRHDIVLLRLPPDAFELGVVPALNDILSYDPQYFEPGVDLSDLYSPPDGLTWITATSLTATDGPSFGANVVFPGRTGGLTATVVGDDRITLHWMAGPGDPAVFFRIRAHASATERFYGLGEVFDTPSHRGKVRPMQVAASTKLESYYNEVHVPIPFLIGTSGWGLFVESLRPGVFAVATEGDDLIKSTTGLGPAWEDGLTVHLYSADSALDVTRRYYETTGFPKLPAPWALGPWLWRDETSGQAEVEADLATIRQRDLATSGFWIDRPYASGVNSFDFKPADYADPAAMIAGAHAAGFRMAVWHTPYIDPSDPATSEESAAIAAKGYYAPISGAEAKWGPMLDLTNPDAVTYWQGRLAAYQTLGIEGYKLDYGEEVIPGAFGVRSPWSFFDGRDEMTLHRDIQRLYHKTYAAMLPEDGGFLLCRAGTYGDQVNGPIIWPGDIDASMLRHGEVGKKSNGDDYFSVGGLPAAIAAGSSLGPSGFPFFAADTGGYRNSPPNKETYLRWVEQSAFSPAMQVGTSTNDLPWRFGNDHVDDPEIVDTYRRYARWHMRLFPYVWSLANALLTDGRPIQRPLGLAYPTLPLPPTGPEDAYALGDDLIVAPVVKPGATTVEVALPPGGWTDIQTGVRKEGGVVAGFPAALDHIVVLLRDGGILPLLRDTIDTLAPTADPSVDSFASAAGPLVLRVAPDQTRTPRTVTLYDGTTVAVTYGVEQNLMLVTVTPGSVFDVDLIVEVIGATPTAAAVAGQPLPPKTEDELKTEPGFGPFTAGTRIHLPPNAHALTITL